MVTLLDNEYAQTKDATISSLKALKDFYTAQYNRLNKNMSKESFGNAVSDAISKVGNFIPPGISTAVTIVEELLLWTSSSEYDKFKKATISARNTIDNLIAFLEPKTQNNSGIVKFELRVVYTQFTMNDKSKCSVFNYATVTGYYDKYGNKATQ